MTAMGLTPRQAETLAFIRRYIAEHNGASPTRREICAGLGMKSASDVHQILERLRDRGHITWAPRQARAITILEDEAARAESGPAAGEIPSAPKACSTAPAAPRLTSVMPGSDFGEREG